MSNVTASPYVASKTGCYRHAAECVERDDFFNTYKWQVVLASLGAQADYYWSEDLGDGFTTSTFKKGPFSIAYVGFPEGKQTISKTLENDSVLGDVIQSCLATGVAAVRVAGLENASLEKYHCEPVTDSEIENLAGWDIVAQSSTIRRNIKKSVKSGVEVTDVVVPGNSETMYSLYLETVERNKGVARYTQNYFRALLNLALDPLSSLHVYSAYLSGELIAYTITANHQNDCVYLHGAQAMKHQNVRAMDALFERMIGDARESGCGKFSFQASPKKQTGLIKYKEKWGAVSKCRSTVTAYGSGMIPMALRMVLQLRR